jgi:hypothetical protein
MSTRVLANAAVFALGVVLILGGAWGIAHGAGYTQLEWGWTSVISGTVAATGGVLALALGFVLHRLDALQIALLNAGARPAIAPAEEVPSMLAEPPPPPVSEPAVAPMPLGLQSTPAAPPAATYADPAALAAQAVNLELLDHEEPRRAAAAREPFVSQEPQSTDALTTHEPPPEIAHAADQGPADDMVKAAGVSDEPELDAAIEQLLAEERGTGAKDASSPPAGVQEAAPEVLPAPLASDETAKPAPRSGWRGLFSRKERRAAAPPPAEPVWEQQSEDARLEAEESLPMAEVEPPKSAPIAADAIPRTGADWFDRALSGLDEVYEPLQQREAHHAPAPPEHRGQSESVQSESETHARSSEEPPVAAPAAEPAVIGRYTSGNTTYVMFADGSIEAETPTGVLRFASLAELKVYVEGGQ